MAMQRACFQTRKLERATYNLVAFRFIAANDHPDHDTIAAFRRRFLKEIEALFVQVLLLAREMGVLKMGTIALDGTKIHANASRHSALSYEHAGKIEAQLQAEVADLMAKAEAADTADIPDGVSIPDELARRESVCASLPKRARRLRRAPRSVTRGSWRSMKPNSRRARPRPRQRARSLAESRRDLQPQDRCRKIQINLTDEESRIMPVAGGSFEQSYNAQAAVAAGSMLVVAIDVAQAPNDKQQLEPMLGKIEALPEELGDAETLLADTGYFSAGNVEACENSVGSNR